jgi:general secretion pathway protein E
MAEDDERERQERTSRALLGAAPCAAGPEALDGAAAAPWIDALLAQAIALRVTDVHLELAADAGIVRYRLDGVLYPARHVERASFLPIVRELELRAGLSGVTPSLPRSGRMSITAGVGAVVIDLFVVPTRSGERVVIRILEPAPPALGEIGLSPSHLAFLERLFERSRGLLISCGPTGSGKSTTLYALARELARRGCVAVAVEGQSIRASPPLPTIAILPRDGLMRAVGAALESDPGVLLIEELLDRAAIELALEVAGARIVLAASNALSFERLDALGVEPGRVRERVSAILHQRLVRVLCAGCKEAYEADGREVEAVGAGMSRVTLYRAAGCSACGYTGFRGRTGVFAFEGPVGVDEDAPAVTERLREDGMRQVLAGITTYDEVVARIPCSH